MFRIGSYLSYRKLTAARAILRQHPDSAVREEGLACLRSAKPEYLCNLIPQDHPDRIAAVRWLTENQGGE